MGIPNSDSVSALESSFPHLDPPVGDPIWDAIRDEAKLEVPFYICIIWMLTLFGLFAYWMLRNGGNN